MPTIPNRAVVPLRVPDGKRWVDPSVRRVPVIIARSQGNGYPFGPGGREWPHWEFNVPQGSGGRSGGEGYPAPKFGPPLITDEIDDSSKAKAALGPSKGLESPYRIQSAVYTGARVPPVNNIMGYTIPTVIMKPGPKNFSLTNVNAPQTDFKPSLNAPAKIKPPM